MTDTRLTLITFPNCHSHEDSWSGKVAEDMIRVGRDGLKIYPEHYVTLPVPSHEVVAGFDNDGKVRIIWEIEASTP